MENVFCLFGFSGDDPNFLNWSGWVRDALGKHAPVIYLIGVLGLTDSKRRLLEARNVIPLDLAQVFPQKPAANLGEQHKAAMEWVLLSLMAGQPVSNTSWPDSSRRYVPEPQYSREVPPLKPREESRPTLLEPQPVHSNVPLFTLYKAWEENRKRYPG